MTTIQEFKQAAITNGHFYDNSSKAASNWSRTWGLTWWRDVWFYKEYRLGNLTYRTGKVCMRHRSYSNREYCIDNNPASEKEFLKALASILAPAVVPVSSSSAARFTASGVPSFHSRLHRASSPRYTQLTFAF